ncbi:MAG: ABC transporter permease [Nocardioides sp.]
MSSQLSTADAVPSVDATVRIGPKNAIALSVAVAGLALLLLLGGHSGSTTFRIAADSDFAELPDITLAASWVPWLLVALCAAIAAASWWLTTQNRSTPLWLVSVFAFVGMIAFLIWAGAGETIPMIGLLQGTIFLAVPLIFGAVGGVIGERAGVVNIAIDGQLLFGAFAAALTSSLTGSPWAGLIAAAAAGALVALILAVFAISYYVDQVIVGVVLNVLLIGVTSFFFDQLLSSDPAKFNTTARFSSWAVPVLGDIPIIGPVLFRQTLIVYLMYVVVGVVTWALYRSKWGLRLRAVGEHPKAADTVGINVIRTRYRAIILGGAIAGLGGAFYTLVAVSQFTREMTGGAGYIALAAVIFGRWDPLRATLAALLFGFAQKLQGTLSAINSPVPSEFMLMLPYVVTLLAVAGLVGKSRAPAADGVPYVKT